MFAVFSLQCYAKLMQNFPCYAQFDDVKKFGAIVQRNLGDEVGWSRQGSPGQAWGFCDAVWSAAERGCSRGQHS